MKHFTEFVTDYASSTQFLLFAVIMISMWLTERTLLFESLGGKWRHSSVNALFILSALPVQIVLMLLCMTLAGACALEHWGLIFLLEDHENPWIKYGVMFVVLDFLDYVYHFTMHRVPLFWRFHLVHHTDPTLDVSTTVREHPGETIVRNLFLILWVLICGASVEVLILRQTVETIANIFAHTRFRLPPTPARIVGWLFVTPNLHHAHHHFQLPSTNCNYGDVFSVWDRLFGTFIDLPADETVFGLDTHLDEGANGRFLDLVAMPFPPALRRLCGKFFEIPVESPVLPPEPDCPSLIS